MTSVDRHTPKHRRRLVRRWPLRWPRPLSSAELDAYGHGYSDGWNHASALGRANA